MRPDAYQAEHGLLSRVLRGFLVDKVESSRGAGEFDRVACGAGAALESLLAAHPVDGRGRCRWCRGPGWLGRRRVCMVFEKAHYWLRQPAHRVQTHLAGELGVDLPTPLGAPGPDVTEVLPRIADDPTTDPVQTSADSPIPAPGAGWPDRDHGGGAPEHPWLRGGPIRGDLPPGPGRSLPATGATTWSS